MKAQHALKPLAFSLAAFITTAALADGSGASAVIMDLQMLEQNYVKNAKTENSATMAGSINNASGSLPVNIAAGDANQQANAGALSAADAFFVLGSPVNASAMANIILIQDVHYNELVNWGAHNTASMLNSVNHSSGNIAVNIAAGNYNQQKNDFAVAYSQKAFNAIAMVHMEQHSHNNEIYNYADSWLSAETDAQSLAAATSGYKPPIHHVINNASILGSLNGLSGYVGVNVAAGGANQQSNALAIAAGCTACQK